MRKPMMLAFLLAWASLVGSVGFSPNHAPRSWVKLSPAMIHPGSVVSLVGYVPPSGSTSSKSKTGIVYFGGIINGEEITMSNLHWNPSRPGHFTASFRVPSEPWIDAEGMHPWTSATYPVSVQCVGSTTKQCLYGPVQATANVYLTIRHPIARASLVPKETRVKVGETVTVKGWAPLNSTGKPGGYYLVMTPDGVRPDGLNPEVGQVRQLPNGQFAGSFHVPEIDGGYGQLHGQPNQIWLQSRFQTSRTQNLLPGYDVDVASVIINPQTPLTWKTLHLPSVETIQTNLDDGSFSLNVWTKTGDPQLVMYATDHTIWLKGDGTSSWRQIPTARVHAASKATPYPVPTRGFEGANEVAVAPRYPKSVFAAFGADVDEQTQTSHNVAYETRNAGMTWQPIPVPAGYTMLDFGGLRMVGQAVEVYFNAPRNRSFIVETTVNGGQTWMIGTQLPSSTTFLHFGPTSSKFLSLTNELVLGSSLQVTPALVPVEIAQFSRKEALVVAPADPAMLLLTVNGGKSFRPVNVPWPNVTILKGTDSYDETYGQVQWLPNGDLLAQIYDVRGGWAYLKPGQTRWHKISRPIEDSRQTITIIDHNLWWTNYANGTVSAHHTSIASLTIPN